MENILRLVGIAGLLALVAYALASGSTESASNDERDRVRFWLRATIVVGVIGFVNTVGGMFSDVPLIWAAYSVAPWIAVWAATRLRLGIVAVCWLVAGIGPLFIGPAIGVWPTWLAAPLAVFPLIAAVRHRRELAK